MVHFGSPLLFRVLGGFGCADQHGVHNVAAPYHPSCPLQAAVNGVKKQLPDPVPFQQIPEMHQCGGVRDILLKKLISMNFRMA